MSSSPSKPSFDVGGQAVIEGVMMRSAKSFTVVCRKPDQSIIIKEEAWKPLWKDISLLRKPFFRGIIVLIESLWNGMSSLSFSAEQQEEEKKQSKTKQSKAAMIPVIAISVLFAIGLFVAAPHAATWALGSLLSFDITSTWFHIIDGTIKMFILVGYMAIISLLPDIYRVFQYHGAEHKAIFTYEQNLPLTLEHAKKQSRFHPRCGTSFLLIVIMVSTVVFSGLLTIPLSENTIVDHLLKILVKIPLMLPVAGISYELIKISGKRCETSTIAKMFARPGMLLQRITTKEPEDNQLEIALIAIRKTLWRENQPCSEASEPIIETYNNICDIDFPLAT